MDTFKFIFWEVMKTLSLALVGLLAAKAIGALKEGGPKGERGRDRRLAWLSGALYAVVVVLVIVGAQGVGKDLAARFYFAASQRDLARLDASGAYANAARAVALRPADLRYWRVLARSKFSARQFASMLEDRPAFQALGGGDLEEEDALRFAFAYFLLAQYDNVIPLAEQIIRENHFYAEPYVLEGTAYTALRKYTDAERTFLAVLQMFPTQEDAVRGLAQVYFLMGNRPRAIAVLDETEKFSFSPEARKRFADLKELYSQ